jgi:competence protein ComEA
VILGLVAAAAFAQVDLNRAGAEVLEHLPGIGPAKAEAIVAWRSAHGPCRALSDLLDVPGIGAATIGMLQGRAFCGRGQAAEAPSVARSAAPIARPLRIDINRATAAELSELPGITEARARAIVEERRADGPFASCADLVRVPGIGPATVQNLGDTCMVSSL